MISRIARYSGSFGSESLTRRENLFHTILIIFIWKCWIIVQLLEECEWLNFVFSFTISIPQKTFTNRGLWYQWFPSLDENSHKAIFCFVYQEYGIYFNYLNHLYILHFSFNNFYIVYIWKVFRLLDIILCVRFKIIVSLF